MIDGEGATEFDGCSFPTRAEAQWAVFFETYRTTWYYLPEGWPTGNEEHYRPQFWLIERKAYLEVQRPDDHSERRPLRHVEPKIEEPTVYLSMGGIPTLDQLRAEGWWDPRQRRGIMNLTPGYDWGHWFPPDFPDVIAAVEAAWAEKFESPTVHPPVPPPRTSGEGVNDIPEWEREHPPSEGTL
jgi:hypothetical protein